MVSPENSERNSKMIKNSFANVNKLEFTFFISKHHIKICKKPTEVKKQHKRNDLRKNKKNRDPFRVGLMDVISVLYSGYNKHCTINFVSTNVYKEERGFMFYGRCIHKTCRQYKFKLLKVNSISDENAYSVEVFVDRLQIITHEKNAKVGFIKGIKRKIIKKQMQTMKPLEFRNKAMVKSKKIEGKTKLVNRNVLKMARSEVNKALYRDQDDFEDLRLMCEENPNYLKQLYRIPFGFINYSAKVFNLLGSSSGFSKILYLDGTGSVVKFSKKSKRIQLYVLLAFHFSTNATVPISYFVSESHSTIDFNNWLNIVRSSFESNKKRFAEVAKIINIDWSWALAGGVIRALNKGQHEISDYIQQSFEICTSENPTLNFTVIHFCYCHWMKVVANDLNKYHSMLCVKTKFMNCMRVAVRLKTMQELEVWFKLVIVIFCSPSKTDFFIAANDEMKIMINNVMKGKSNDDLIEFEILTEEELSKIEEFNKTFIIDNNNTNKKKRIFKDSPFFNRFSNLMGSIKETINPSFGPEERNFLYFPDFIETILVGKYMSIACFWSNLLIKFIYPRMDITSNARIEKYFGKVKHNIMKGNLNQRPTNFIRLLEEDILSTVRQIDLGFEDVFATKKGLENAKRREHSRQYIFNYEGLESEESCIPENLEQCRDIWRSKYHPKGGLFSHLFQKGVSNKDRAILPFVSFY